MKIQILMSTYNGEKYIGEQLDSIISQKGVDKTLLIRDDGSFDQTVEIIKDYQKRYPWISYYQGENIGVKYSFFDLIMKADKCADFISFSDQDDVWYPDKLRHAVRCLKSFSAGEETPLLYCSSQTIVDEELEPISVTVSRDVYAPSFGNALVQNICTGCTAVINRSLLLLIRNNMPKHVDSIIMHDWWLYLSASCFGKVFFDRSSYLLYRQHSKNAFGAITNRRRLLKYRLQQLIRPRGEIYSQAEEFYSSYYKPLKLQAAESNSNEKLLYCLLSARKALRGRLKLIAEKQIFRQKVTDNCVYKLAVLIGKL